MKITGKNYKERCQHQLDEWVKGNPIHNNIDDECCPDFSCCLPEMLADEDTRKLFKAAYEQGKDDVIEGMCFVFLEKTWALKFPDKKICIVDGKTEITKNQN